MAWLQKKRRKNSSTGEMETYWWICTRDARGKLSTKGIGFCEKKEAERALKVFEGKLAAGEAATPTVTAPGSSPAARSRLTLATYLDERYLPVVERDKAPRTAECARRAAVQLKQQLGELPLDQVTYAAVDRYLTERRKLGRKSRTLILELWTLRGCLEHAKRCEEIDAVPELPKIKDRDRRPHRFLTTEQSVALLDALRPLDAQPHVVTRGKPPIQRDRLTYLAVLFALNTGARRNEILTRGWEDVRWGQGKFGAIVIGAKPEVGFRTKTGKERAIPLNAVLRAELESAWDEAGRPARGWVFPSPTDPSKPRKDFRKALIAAAKRAGVPRVHPHAMRHSFATRLAIAGVDRRTLMELGGWTDSSMLDEVYAHTTDDHKAEVMARTGVASSSAARKP